MMDTILLDDCLKKKKRGRTGIRLKKACKDLCSNIDGKLLISNPVSPNWPFLNIQIKPS